MPSLRKATLLPTKPTSRSLPKAKAPITGRRVFAIGDIHGCLKTFKALLKAIKFGPSDVAYLLGDYIDKGPRIRKLVDFIRKYQASGNFVPVRGNHEQYLLDSVSDPVMYTRWLKRHGGFETLESFNVPDLYSFPSDYLEWFDSLPYTARVTVGKQAFVMSHAGVNTGSPNPFVNTLINRTYVLFNRDDHKKHHRIRNIVGHSVKPLPEIMASVDGDSTIYLDGGCVAGKYLVALDLSSMGVTAVRCID